jgi:hypothetical protein
MMLGLSGEAFTILHVTISLIGIASGALVLRAMLQGRRTDGIAATFLATTVLTSVTGFMFPISGLTPAHVVGALSLAVLAVALFALYVRRMAGPWRAIYVVSATASLYLNVFVGVVQAFQKLPPLQSMAPTQSEPPFVAAQTFVLAAFLLLGVLAVRRYRPTVQAVGSL